MKQNDLTNKLLLVFFFLTLIPNAIQFYSYKSYQRFDWMIGVISSKENIVRVSKCNFKGNFYGIREDMILDNGWKRINKSENNMKETFLPDSLSITWFSYKEQIFFEGVFILPYEKIVEKASDMGIKNDYTSDRVLHFIAEVLPKGKVNVWMQKINKDNTEIKFKVGTYQAKQIKATWHIFDNRYETDKISNIDIDKKVALVLEPHRYKVNIKLPEGYSLKDSNFNLFNQKRGSFNQSKWKDTTFSFLPENFYLKWGNGKNTFATDFSFYENEVLNAFRKEKSINEKNQLETLILELKVNDFNNTISVELRNTITNSEFIFHDKYKSQFGGSITRIIE
jgi:hypothetical protein